MDRKWILLLSLFFLMPPAPGLAVASRCAHQPEILVTTDDLEILGEICQAAEKAIIFLGQYGLRPKRTISIDVVETKIESHGDLAYGLYESGRDRIQLMSYAAIFENSSNPTIYDEPFDRVHYSGVIAHEVAHAVMDHNFVERDHAIAPQEYMAHATHLAVIPKARRDAIIAAMRVTPWEEGDVVSQIYMAMNPGRFAVKSYLHLTTLAHPESFVRILLNNKWFYVNVPRS